MFTGIDLKDQYLDMQLLYLIQEMAQLSKDGGATGIMLDFIFNFGYFFAYFFFLQILYASWHNCGS
jgi:hypothetical protein